MLTDTACRGATCPPDRQRLRLHDVGGLYLEVAPNGSRRWFWKYRKPGKEGRMALGSYPAVGLAAARQARDAAAQVKAAGVDPVATRKAGMLRAACAGLGDTFGEIAQEWYERKATSWSQPHASRELRNLHSQLIPWLGPRKVADIEAVELLVVVRRVEQRGALVAARRVLGTARGVLAYAIATGRAARNVAQDLAGALTVPKVQHHAAITDPLALGALLRAMHAYEGHPCTVVALKLSPLLLVRPGELRRAQWSEIDLDSATWAIPADKMKMRHDHIVPLPAQAVAMLRELHSLTGHGPCVFSTSAKADRPMSENTVNKALRAMGYPSTVQTAHGFRATARTILDEVLNQRIDLVEHQLAHTVKDANGRAYNRTAHLPARRTMMQTWADYLDQLRVGATIIPFPVSALKTVDR